MPDIMTIEQALGNSYCMFYHSALPTSKLTPMCKLQHSVNQVNQFLANAGPDIGQWPPGYQDEIARLLWVNWIWQRLPIEPIRKPILVHLDQNDYVVDCGDTRLMALSLLDTESMVSVVCTTTIHNESKFTGWTRIRNNQDLIDASGFSSSAGIFLTPSEHSEYALSWLEIGDSSTAHHLHNIDQRVAMIQRYIAQQPTDFEFSVDWARSNINWNDYAS